MSATAPPRPAGTACPRCGAHVADNQDWCLQCGDAARTRLVPTPNWRLPIALAAIVAAVALLAIAVSFVQLTRDDAPVPPATATTPAPAAAAPATTAPPTTAPPTTAAPTTAAPTTTTPGATTTTPTTPGATTPAPGSTTTTPGATPTPGATTTTP